MFSLRYSCGVCKHNTTGWTLQIYISQGIGVATQLMCGAIFTNHFIINFLQNVLVKMLKIGQYSRRYGQKFAAYFLGHLVNA